MTTYVLVPGAWGGAWLWEPVTRDLRARGHEVHPVTLPGLSAHAAEPATAVTLAEHVTAVHELIERMDLTDVVLAGHSYAGIVTGQVAAAEPERVAHAVFVDANLPVEGESLVGAFSPAGQDHMHESIAANGGMWLPPTLEELAGAGLDGPQAELFVSRAVPHPGLTVTQPAALARPLSQLRATYVNCTVPNPAIPQAAEALREAPGWTFTEIATGHWPMLTAPVELAEILLKAG
ncbi:alpha/beta fold hydrolase [Phytomonospora endophytica]|uniref:Pimeloyl-ACP methyl ester carboxylesterase n=1 Tax=Phytomonospora endophytica TaxID=714109 RepID=A0A841FDU1_9ACTN|nr:alpha/beta hydrolase [Phytomonospora endophytica]MBB6035441.1 pimeloyl-ACP methyl ester carboxylesterase [Phytomonospora endophytica]GIG63806.1 esterase [Phytomonospora endophytica]